MQTTTNLEAGQGGLVALGKLLDALKNGDKLLCINAFIAWIMEDDKKPSWYLMILAETVLAALADAKQVGFIQRITSTSLSLERNTNASV